jgi:hypothetical protein
MRHASLSSIHTSVSDTFGNSNANGHYRSPNTPPLSIGHKKYMNGASSGHNRGSTANQPRRGSQFGIGNDISFVQETATALKRKSMSELGAGVSQSVTDASFINFVEWIRSERLATLPHKGSRWDKVLIRALYFAERLHNFENAVQGFAFDSNDVAQLGYGHARLLLQVCRLLFNLIP